MNRVAKKDAAVVAAFANTKFLLLFKFYRLKFYLNNFLSNDGTLLAN